MNYTVTTNLDYSSYLFLQEQSKKTKQTKKSIIEEALKMYEKNKLKEQIEAWLTERYQEYKDLNNELLENQISSLKL